MMIVDECHIPQFPLRCSGGTRFRARLNFALKAVSFTDAPLVPRLINRFAACTRLGGYLNGGGNGGAASHSGAKYWGGRSRSI